MGYYNQALRSCIIDYMDRVEEFFHYIAPRIIDLTKKRFENTKEITYKDKERNPNIATEGDYDNEKLIKDELSKWFLNDLIVAEETSSDTNMINVGRSWIIDPICGSYHFKNGIKFFCTNVTLSEKGILVASLVVDHSREEYVYSVGDGIYINRKKIKPQKKTQGIHIEVDLSGLMGTPNKTIERHKKLVSYLLKDKRVYLSSLNTSLPFAYVALARIDAYASGYHKIWDVAAANYLILQAGGVVTQMDGSPWNLSSDNTLAALDKNLHEILLSVINS